MTLLFRILWWLVAIAATCGGADHKIHAEKDWGSEEDLLKMTEHVERRKDPPTFPPVCEGTLRSRDCEEDVCQCSIFTSSSGHNGDKKKEATAGARIAYLVTVHNERTMGDAEYLFRAIRYPGNIILLHMDKKLDPSIYEKSSLKKLVEECPCGALVHVDSIYDCKWGSWSMNGPTHWAMDVLIHHPSFRNRWDVFLNLSGDTMPVLTPPKLAALFDPKSTSAPLRHTNFVTSSACVTGLIPTNIYAFPKWWHKRRAYTHAVGDLAIDYVDDDGNHQKTTLIIHFGSQWMSLQPDFVTYLVKSLQREDSLPSLFKKALIRSEVLMTDETFIPTLLMNVSPFNHTLPLITQDGSLESMPSLFSIRYERMDENVPSAFGYFPTQQRYDVADSSLADKPRQWGPYFVGVYDLQNILDSGALFVRKVSVHVDPNLVYMLPVDNPDVDLPAIQWPDEVKISKKPNWEALKASIIAEANEEKKRRKTNMNSRKMEFTKK
mmetsp:Transcript_16032/g.29156  ORF Transcript_16032/g.29156 Transcript_16032/m.29156 type:complete len:493 (-) Transcript_16032:1767-3245(-)|eukprot:CAMPEP_0198296628 /NCGR_PEP_ID=MMETSP1449-20131203/33262_1 /TAXON_ID=420275 /ORGANISM="Attheya septentrionalis, Strain CCMP2084" /LENGTH=492 /DNA_ID=CAMNT_0043997293 /DNA_START=56 /DNA_END=1534 /DNA_ORIENTATION=-